MELLLDTDIAFNHLTATDVRKALQNVGIRVYRCARLQVKMPDAPDSSDRKNWLPMGTGLRNQFFNLSIKPMSSSIAAYKWPPFFDIWFASKKTTIAIPYKLGGDLSKAVCASSFKSCKRSADDCVCDSTAGGAPASRSAGKRPQRPTTQREGAFERSGKYTKAAERFADMFTAKLKPGELEKIECRHFSKGLCVLGSNCKFNHGDPSKYETIVCKKPKSTEKGLCRTFPRCVYAPCAERARQMNGSSSNESCMPSNHA